GGSFGRHGKRGKPTAPARAGRGADACVLAGAALEPAALALGQPAPDAESFVVAERVFQAVGPDVTPAAHPLRLPGRPTLLREERLRIGLGAQRLFLPWQGLGAVLVEKEALFGHGVSSPAVVRRALASTVVRRR